MKRPCTSRLGTIPLVLVTLAVAFALGSARNSTATEAAPEPGPAVTILVYHRFGPAAVDRMTVTTPVFAWQLKYLRDNGYAIVALRDVVNFVMGRGNLPPRAVAIAADDGHRTVFTEMKPLVERYRFPVTLFIYPSAISNASYAMTWEQLRTLKETGLFDIQSHTYWHPNFHIEKRRLSADDYRMLVRMQLDKSRQVLQSRLETKVDMLSWPFGIYDDELIAAARQAGYIAAFTIERRSASRQDKVMAIPRFIVTNADRQASFPMLLSGKSSSSHTGDAGGYDSE